MRAEPGGEAKADMMKSDGWPANTARCVFITSRIYHGGVGPVFGAVHRKLAGCFQARKVNMAAWWFPSGCATVSNDISP